MTEENHTAVILHSKSVAAGKNAAIAFGFEAYTRNPAPALGTGAIITALSLYLKRDVLTDTNYIKEPRHEL